MNKQINQTLSYDWFSKSLDEPLHCHLSLDDASLNFRIQTNYSSFPHPDSLPQQFTPELWKYDVFELFLASPQGLYLELNLSQSGAWWGAWFSAPRILSTEPIEIDKVTTHSTPHSCELSLPVDQLQPLGNFKMLTWNITAITHSPKQRFSSAAKLPGEHPDFHQPAHFLPLF